jgi:hypothetical protein
MTEIKREANSHLILEQVCHKEKRKVVTWKTARRNEGVDGLEFSPRQGQECGVHLDNMYI